MKFWPTKCFDLISGFAFLSLLSRKLELNLEASNLAASINYLKLCACVPMCLWYLCGSAVARGGLLELELQAFVSHRVGAENQIQSARPSLTDELSLQPQ